MFLRTITPQLVKPRYLHVIHLLVMNVSVLTIGFIIIIMYRKTFFQMMAIDSLYYTISII